MPNREKVIDALEKCAAAKCDERCPYSEIQYGCRPKLMLDAMVMLKEQEKQRFFVDESGKITPLPVVVRCEDCKHSKRYGGLYGCEFGNGLHDKDWYCADGER